VKAAHSAKVVHLRKKDGGKEDVRKHQAKAAGPHDTRIFRRPALRSFSGNGPQKSGLDKTHLRPERKSIVAPQDDISELPPMELGPHEESLLRKCKFLELLE